MTPASNLSSLRSIEEVVSTIEREAISEHLHANVELKDEWAQKHGGKISTLSNKLDQIVTFLIIGVSDDGKLVGRSEKWAKQTEEIVSQHINQQLDPVQACKNIVTRKIGHGWVVIVTIQNPGEVTYWGNHAYQAAGTTIAEMEPEEILKLRIQLPGLIDYSNQTHRSS
ncbi:MAG: RNA-binding domain-containing protein, partial [Chthoniobacteraceae bacterium]